MNSVSRIPPWLRMMKVCVVSLANDTTHTFLIRNQGGIRETEFIDSMALNVNQKYIYYKVRAVDYSTNIGPWSH